MGGVIGDLLPLAVGVAISPLPIIAVILMLLAPEAGATSVGFLAGWVVGILAVTIVVTIIAGVAGLSTSGGGSRAGGVIKIVAGALLLVLALKQWRSRPHDGHEPTPPKWLSAIDSVTPVKATGLGLALAAVNPKNLLMILGAGVIIGSAGLPIGQIVVTIAIFTIIAAISVAAPVVVYELARPEGTRRPDEAEDLADRQQRNRDDDALLRHRRRADRQGDRHFMNPHQMLASALLPAFGGLNAVECLRHRPEWNVRLKPWGGREDHDYGRNDQS